MGRITRRTLKHTGDCACRYRIDSSLSQIACSVCTAVCTGGKYLIYMWYIYIYIYIYIYTVG